MSDHIGDNQAACAPAENATLPAPRLGDLPTVYGRPETLTASFLFG